ncbi:Uu.00g074290.m01.CDS01 [Anthostomella pinea]|uniref:Uu.00g074290.m01.CDS01 n=1 Tax=Anthostomella pinea TaxID=933095 RepID=A0AAI8VW65_9PEZI|nr:Uu.00g074290.m01.CDS01 [Anthostomella pinea]
MAVHHIWRDPWERKLESEKNCSGIRRNSIDYPEAGALLEIVDTRPAYDVSTTLDSSGNLTTDWIQTTVLTPEEEERERAQKDTTATERYHELQQPEAETKKIPDLLAELRALGVTVVDSEPRSY